MSFDCIMLVGDIKRWVHKRTRLINNERKTWCTFFESVVFFLSSFHKGVKWNAMWRPSSLGSLIKFSLPSIVFLQLFHFKILKLLLFIQLFAAFLRVYLFKTAINARNIKPFTSQQLISAIWRKMMQKYKYLNDALIRQLQEEFNGDISE